ncbi:MAG: GNAT family N-acetyltransferase [Bacteriovorax sp.]|nr:GNAT family N-acetyltransferase [Bacteriovorax sp.]
MKILNWTVESLLLLKDLLDQSAGYDISIEDEVEYFNPAQSTSWLYTVNDENLPTGFIRFFRHSGGFCSGEIFVPHKDKQREEVLCLLLDNFLERFEFQPKDRVRFDIPINDLALTNSLKSKGFISLIETYICYKKDLNKKENNLNDLIYPTMEQFEKIKETLIQIHSFSDEEIETAITTKNILTIDYNNDFAVASRFSIKDDKAEIIEIVTDQKYRNKGLGSRFLEVMANHLFDKGIRNIYLFVKDSNLPAIKLYEKADFTIDDGRSQIWLSKEWP